MFLVPVVRKKDDDDHTEHQEVNEICTMQEWSVDVANDHVRIHVGDNIRSTAAQINVVASDKWTLGN